MNCSKRYTLEICAGSWDSVVAARDGGADRIELCTALSEGGLTPSIGLITAACCLEGISVHVLIRPRGGDFLYTDDEAALIEADICHAIAAGANGVVVGSLTQDGNINESQLHRWVTAAAGHSVTFHRAFDLCQNPEHALETIIACGCNRLLTSGQADKATNGLQLLTCLVRQAADRISIMPGCGVNAINAAEILRKTGACEIHASARRPLGSHMQYRRDNVSMGQPCDEYVRLETHADEVRAIRHSIDTI